MKSLTLLLSLLPIASLMADAEPALEIQIPMIRAISIVPQMAAGEQEIVAEGEIDIQISCDQGKMRELLAPYVGKEISEELLQKMKEAVLAELVSEGNALFVVQVPEQNVTCGKVSLVAMPACAGQVCVSGNRWFSASSILSAFDVSSGDCLQERALLDNGAWINRNPFIHTDVIVSPGLEKGEADLEIASKDRFPARFYAGTDNTGSSVSGNERFYAGTNFSIGLRTLFTYQFTSGYDFPEFLSHTVNATFFLPFKHEIVFYGGYATIHPAIDSFESKGQDIQASFRYAIPLRPLVRSFPSQVIWGADYKQTDSSLFFLGALPDGTAARVPVNQKTADLFQFFLCCQAEDTSGSLRLNIKGELLFSPFKFLPHQTALDYDSLRQGANVRYIYGRAAFGTIYKLARDFEAAALLRAQVASGALLPSEQYGLGGYDTVRGYQERVFLADNAAIGNFEVRTPAFHFFKNRSDSLLFLAFLDAAFGANWSSSPAFPKDAWLMGAGAGLRYTIAPYVSARCDYGFRIHNTPFANSQIGRLHFSASIAY